MSERYREHDETRQARAELTAALSLEPLARIHLLSFGLGLAMLASSLQWEPTAWEGPVFGLIFEWLTPSGWAVVCMVVALAKLIACAIYPKMAPAALALGNALFTVWTVSFVIAYVVARSEGSEIPIAPLLSMFGAWLVGEHIAVASLLQRERRIGKRGR